MSKKLCLVLSLALIAVSIFSCGTDPEKIDDRTEATTTIAETGMTEVKYSLPEMDFKGEEFKILLRSTSWTPKDIYVESENGEVFNDAVFNRNRKISEAYNIKITASVAEQATGSALNTFISSAILSGQHTYDLTMIRVSDAAILAQNGVFANLMNPSIEHLDFNQKFWQYEQILSTTVANKLYYATGLATNAADAMSVCFINKDIAADFGLPDIYKIVSDGKFTIDVMYEHSKKVSKDLNGDSLMTKVDQFGVSAQTSLGRSLLYSCNESVINKDKNDIPFVKIGDSRSIQVVDKISGIINNPEFIFMGETADMKSMFYEGRALYYFASLANAEAMRSLDVDFGVLPTPKYDEAQEDYSIYLNSHNPCGVSIPITADAERAAFMLQALAMHSQEEVIPAYYEICLSNKYLRDKESVKMLDIIFKGWKTDLIDAYAWSGFSGLINNAIITNSGIAAVIESTKTAVDEAIARTVSVYEKQP